jgi:hypothetical protein
MAALGGYAAFVAALKAAGMPAYADERQDFGVQASASPQQGGVFEPTPLSIPGGALIDTATLHTLLAKTPKPLVLDVGRGTAVIAGAILLWPQTVWGDQDKILDAAVAAANVTRDRQIIVMGDGPFGWASYNAALHVIAKNLGAVLWYRGGEEAWVAAGYPAQDQRPQ